MIDFKKKLTKRKQKKQTTENEGTRIAEEPTHVLETTIGTFLPSFLTESNGYKTDDHMQPQDKVPHSIKQNQDLSTFDITHLSLALKKKKKGKEKREPNPLWRFTFYSEDESSLNITDQVLTLLMLKLIVNGGMF